MTSPDLFVVCKNCREEVSPYITECPYCGTRLRKRAPKIEREGPTIKPPKQSRLRRGSGTVRRAPSPAATPRLGRLRAGEIPGIRGDELARPWATIVLVFLSFGVWLSLAFTVRSDLALTALGGDPWRYVTAPFVNGGTSAQLAAVLGLGLFGMLLERRHGALVMLLVFVICGPGALIAATAIDPNTLVFGTHPAALGLLCAWAVPVLLARARGNEDDSDLLGVLVIGVVLLLIPAATQGSVLAGGIGAGAGALAGLALAGLKPR